jgi:predicted metal-binding membrane protein
LVPSASHKQLWARASAAVLFAGASFVTLNQARTMTGAMQMPGGWEMSMMWMVMPGQTVWGAAWVFVFMWLAMMIAMMLPSVWPMLELYRKAAVASGERLPGLATTLTGAGYFTVWTVFGAVVFAIGCAQRCSAGPCRCWPAPD